MWLGTVQRGGGIYIVRVTKQNSIKMSMDKPKKRSKMECEVRNRSKDEDQHAT
jgi:hypothetical protein